MRIGKYGFLVLVALLVLCFGVGCNAEVKCADTEQTFVKFSGEDGASRTLQVREQTFYSVDNLFWAYVAVKKDGLNTLGESEETTSAVIGKSVEVDGKYYVLRPVKRGPLVGLDAEVGPISYGDWVFRIYGYESWDEANGKFGNLLYKGETTEKTVRINAPDSGDFTPVEFVLTKETVEESSLKKGKLAFGNIYITVPAGMKFYDSSRFTVTLKNGSVLVANGTGLVSGDKNGGEKIPVYFDLASGVNGLFDAGQKTFEMEVTHYKSPYEEPDYIVSTALGSNDYVVLPEKETFSVLFSAGKVSTLYGDLCNLKVLGEGVWI